MPFTQGEQRLPARAGTTVDGTVRDGVTDTRCRGLPSGPLHHRRRRGRLPAFGAAPGHGGGPVGSLPVSRRIGGGCRDRCPRASRERCDGPRAGGRPPALNTRDRGRRRQGPLRDHRPRSATYRVVASMDGFAPAVAPRPRDRWAARPVPSPNTLFHAGTRRTPSSRFPSRIQDGDAQAGSRPGPLRVNVPPPRPGQARRRH